MGIFVQDLLKGSVRVLWQLIRVRWPDARRCTEAPWLRSKKAATEAGRGKQMRFSVSAMCFLREPSCDACCLSRSRSRSQLFRVWCSEGMGPSLAFRGRQASEDGRDCGLSDAGCSSGCSVLDLVQCRRGLQEKPSELAELRIVLLLSN